MNSTFTFVHLTDAHIIAFGIYSKNLAGIIDELNALEPAFVLVTGDQTELGFTEDYQEYLRLIASLKAPIYHVSGNHEAKWSNWGRTGSPKFLKQQPYYSFDHGGVHFVGLDTSIWLEHQGLVDQPQLAWLRENLDAAGPDAPTVLFFHHGPGYLGNQAELLKLLGPYNARLALVGHGHGFEDWERDGIVFQMTGAVVDNSYRILEVEDGEIHSYRKQIGVEPILDRTISLLPTPSSMIYAREFTAPERQVWRVQATGSVQRPVRAQGERLFFGATGGDVYCLDARSGSEVWRTDAGSDVISEIAVSDGRAYLGTAHGGVIALDAESGQPSWEFHTNGPVQGSPVVAEGTVFIGSGDCCFYALDAESGELRWVVGLERMTQSRPVYLEGAVYFGAWDQQFRALDARSGATLWAAPIGGLVYFSPANSNPATDGKRIVAAATPWHEGEPDIFCLDAATGKIIWSRHNPGGKSHCAFSTPFVEAGRLYIASLGGEVYCLSMEDGGEIWRSATGQEAYDNSPVVANGQIYIGGVEGKLNCLDAETGELKWTQRVCDCYLFASPTVWEDLVIAPSINGSVTALRA